MSDASPKAVVLLSGGLDSTTVLAHAIEQGYDVFPISFRYGQLHQAEVSAAHRIADHYGLADRHRIIEIGMAIHGSSLTDPNYKVPRGRSEEAMGEGIPNTYVPARNTLFLSYALSWAESLGAQHIFIGVNFLDFSGYPDCRPEYIAAFETMANLATAAGVEGRGITIHAPLISNTKAEIVEKGTSLKAPLHMTITCYEPSTEANRVIACGQCDACLLRLQGFEKAGKVDPVTYA
jgi:7-cyano-7-deazaguanine synthase